MNTFVTKERFNHLYQVISGQRFLAMQGLGNEVPFFICPFPAEEALEVESMVKRLIARLKNDANVTVLNINLYDLAIELLQKRGIFQQILEDESSMGKDELLELLQNVLDPEEHLAPAIAEKARSKKHDVLFLTGVGEVFPYVRSHMLLNNLQTPLPHHPMVMFFPGEYTYSPETGASLDLFGLLHDDQYYRAFNILNIEP